jgi:hypothetical protein
VFIPKDFTQKILDACESIVDIITNSEYKQLTKNAIPAHLQVPGENEHSHFIAFDFGVCIMKRRIRTTADRNAGLPTLFAYEVLLDDVCRKKLPIPEGFSCYLSGYNKETYINELKEIIVGHHQPENVVLLEIFPHQQKTRIDFYCTQDYLGIKPVCITELIKEGRKLFILIMV